MTNAVVQITTDPQDVALPASGAAERQSATETGRTLETGNQLLEPAMKRGNMTRHSSL